jgi:O-antigen ligase
VAAIAVYGVLKLRIKFGWVLLTLFAALSYGIAQQDQIMYSLEANKQGSSDDIEGHVKSVSNVTTDPSNLERINRWKCAGRMVSERPWFGFGPGTYMFQYGSYQKYSERSGISTNFGTGGSSHSEYLGPLSEQGLTGMILTLVMIIVILHTSSNFIKRTKNKSHSALMKGLILGLVVYWIHGIMNYFLDTEKASVIYWGFIAAVVALDLYSKKEEKLIEQSTSK